MGHGSVIDEGSPAREAGGNALWRLARALPGRRRLTPVERARLSPLFLFTDEQRLPDPRPAIADLPTGAGVIFRHYGDPHREALGREIGAICEKRGLTFLVAEDGALALRLGARGLHLPERALPLARRWRSRFALCTVAAHSRRALRRAQAYGADAAFLSPVFPSKSHPGQSFLGETRFRRLVRTAPLPVYGLGGITAQSARRLRGTMAIGFGAIEGLSPTE